MNKNEKEQFDILKALIEEGKGDKNDIFYGAINVEPTNMNAYDAIVTFDNHKKYVQITTMSNAVLSKDGKTHHADKYDLSLKPNLNDRHINNDIESLKKMGVERKVIKKDEKSIFVSDKLKSTTNNEEDFDKKYKINSAGLINAIYRSSKKKINKYNLQDKKDTSVLVIIDDSSNNFYLRSIINFKRFTKDKRKILEQLSYQNHFNCILSRALEELGFNKDEFFDEIQVYFKNSQTNDSNEFYFFSNNILSSNIELSKKKNLGKIITSKLSNVQRKLFKI